MEPVTMFLDEKDCNKFKKYIKYVNDKIVLVVNKNKIINK